MATVFSFRDIISIVNRCPYVEWWKSNYSDPAKFATKMVLVYHHIFLILSVAFVSISFWTCCCSRPSNGNSRGENETGKMEMEESDESGDNNEEEGSAEDEYGDQSEDDENYGVETSSARQVQTPSKVITYYKVVEGKRIPRKIVEKY